MLSFHKTLTDDYPNLDNQDDIFYCVAIVKNGLFSAALLVTSEGSFHSIFHYCSDLSFGVVN